MLLADTLIPALRALPANSQETPRHRLLELLAGLAADLLQTNDLSLALDRLFTSVRVELRLDAFFHYNLHERCALRLEAHGGLTLQEAASVSSLVFGQGVCGTAARQETMIVVERVQDSAGTMTKALRDMRFDAFICVPLLHRDELLGTLGFGRRGGDDFDEAETYFLQAIASYVALARHRVVTETALRKGLAERDRLIAQQQEMERQIIELTRTSALGAVATTIAHELNQPLAAAANYVAAVRLSSGGNPEQLVRHAREAEGQLFRAGEIIRRIRKMMSREGLDLQVDRLEPIVHEATALVTAAVAGPLPEFRVQIDADASEALVDHIQIVQVLANLLRNLVDVTRSVPGALITLETRRVSPAEVEFRAGLGQADAPEAYLAALALSGSTVSRDGAELGFALSRTLVEAHGGTLRVEHSEEGGTVFAFTVLASQAAENTPTLQ
ncbi:GAF domain-containing sensor histidine kinase [Sphingomonas sp. IC-56]|uniref:sensor histidine kinase n=1 Tax=Sphingomonas sp. IC-56 TaxID=2898529 RepID=UPI001E50B089|nr:GAF domain-containing sensor histidine kinase [Sphingomonas sp. IC-56]MCD2322430.1 GAF domain-containing sensor histidine kinase [Sphingomonas sp. IC-56]